MKGVVFTEFLEMVEDKFSPQVADRIIEQSVLPSGGSYTAIGTYDHNELLQLVTRLSAESGIAVPDLVRAFGKHLFGRFVQGYPVFFTGITSAFDFLQRVEGFIHVEVRKLYPDAELPSIQCHLKGPDELTMIYRSSRPLAHFGEGLIMGCIEHFGDGIAVQVEDLSNGQWNAARFTLTRPSKA